MLFDTINFGIFLPIVFLLYWFVANKTVKIQNLLLLLASYFFYSCWDKRFLFLLISSTLLDYSTGLLINRSTTVKHKKRWMILSVCINLSLLGFFKYYNFFVSSFSEMLSKFGIANSDFTLNIFLPIGISFYTFHGLSYIIDIYNGKIAPEKNFVNYAVFVSFFPLLVAGPIERATHLLPQIKVKREFDYSKAVDGLRQILWGLFKKLVIANHCAVYANIIFNDSTIFTSSTLFMGALIFAIQVYADFSGYTDIAIGTAKLFGIELLQNFSFPYFSRNLTEFWRRWHISLSSWFRDYLYIPLGGNRNGKLITIRNTFIIFLVGGFWHGASWTFIVWGFVNALYLVPSILFPDKAIMTDVVAKGKLFPTFMELAGMIRTFVLIALVCVFFRSPDLAHAITYFYGMASKTLITLPAIRPVALFFLIGFFISVEWMGRNEKHALQDFASNKPKALRLSFYYFLILAIYLSKVPEQQFIYFQF